MLFAGPLGKVCEEEQDMVGEGQRKKEKRKKKVSIFKGVEKYSISTVQKRVDSFCSTLQVKRKKRNLVFGMLISYKIVEGKRVCEEEELRFPAIPYVESG